MADAPICPVTGKPMVRDLRPLTVRYKGLEKTIQMPGWYSEAESIHTGGDMEVSDEALRELKIQADGLLPPVRVRTIRKRLQLTQRQASDLLGGGTNSFQKYESGEILPSRAVSNLLKVLERYPDALNVIRDDVTQVSDQCSGGQPIEV